MSRTTSIELGFRYGELGLAVSLPDPCPDLLAFLRAYFEPYFEISEAPVASPIARLEVRTCGADGPPGAPDWSGGRDVVIDRSQGLLRLDGRVVDRWIRLSPYGAVVRLDGARVELWGASEASLRIPVLRAVEDLVSAALERSGAVFVHASGVVCGGRAVLAVGNKRAGKTTTLCRLLHGFEVSKLANDNVCLHLERGVVVASGWPSLFKVGLGAVAEHAELAGDFPPSRAPLLGDPSQLWAEREKVPLYPRQGAARFGKDVVARAPLGCVLFTEFHTDRAPGLVPSELTAAALEPFLQGALNPNHADWMERGAATRERLRESVAAIAATAAGQASCYRVTWAPSLDDLLRSVPLLRQADRTLRACADPVLPEDGFPPLPDPARPHHAGELRPARAAAPLGREEMQRYVREELWRLTTAVNAAFKGLLAERGDSGQIALRTEGIQVELELSRGYEALIADVAGALGGRGLEAADVIVVPDKIFAVAQGRVAPYELVLSDDPKKTDAEGRARIRDRVQPLSETPVSPSDLILADTYVEPSGRRLATLGAFDHNRIAADVAAAVEQRWGVRVDVVVSDTDTGVDVREPLIGTITICATPLGATRGLSLYEAMRAACAAEFTRGSRRRIPIVVCKPIPRARVRDGIGEFRGYSGRLDAAREPHLAFA